MRAAETYRAERRRDAKALKLQWRLLPRLMNDQRIDADKSILQGAPYGMLFFVGDYVTPRKYGEVRKPLPPHANSAIFNEARARHTMVRKMQNEPERLFGAAIKRGEQILYMPRGSWSKIFLQHGVEANDIRGFWTTGHRFVSRREGAMIGVVAGQLPSKWRTADGDLIFCSDVSWKAAA